MMNAPAYVPPMAGSANAYAPGKLVPGVHDRLVQELERIASEMGVTVADITGASYALTEVERAYLLGFRRARDTGKLGLIYVGAHDPAVTFRGRSIVGALVRNFIPARFIPREELVDLLFKGRSLGSTVECVVVPDFHYDEAPVATKRALSSFLIGRASRGMQTVLGVPSAKVLKELFGPETPQYLKHFEVVQGVHTS